ncbi:TMEM175 family protein [Arthrobacter luteolus]|uniref:TMEM175 family protein n=1 Tax=Arthrobacter luteolus TaxID=98672 RepID=UPI000831C989|nr:TMEM175 family protein [Arthrobacter luteolus]
MGDQLFDRSTVEFGRGISFFDAIYGFAITLLITNIDLPPAAAWGSVEDLLSTGLLSQLFGFLLSFAVIAVFWRVNFRQMAGVPVMSQRLITWNIVAAFFIILIPFTTQGTSDPAAAGYSLPTVLYALNVALASLAQTAVFLSASRHNLAGAAGLGKGVRPLLPHLAVPAVFLASIPVIAVAGPGPGRLVWASLLILSPLAGRLSGGNQRSPAA